MAWHGLRSCCFCGWHSAADTSAGPEGQGARLRRPDCICSLQAQHPTVPYSHGYKRLRFLLYRLPGLLRLNLGNIKLIATSLLFRILIDEEELNTFIHKYNGRTV
eukprot:scaffold296_cov164-Ochromonas_danica.AAC.21